MSIFCAHIDKLPPSTNRLRTVSRNRIITTPEAREYKSYAYEQLKAVEPVEFGEGDSLRIKVVFYFPKLENKGWSKGLAKFRYKKRDITNLLKVLEDVVAAYLNVDDAQFIELTASKVKGEEGVTVWVQRISSS
jgi:Holliday junction resolvase RusA-like endonuclease